MLVVSAGLDIEETEFNISRECCCKYKEYFGILADEWPTIGAVFSRYRLTVCLARDKLCEPRKIACNHHRLNRIVLKIDGRHQSTHFLIFI